MAATQVKGVEYTKIADGGAGRADLGMAVLHSTLKAYWFTYTTAAEEATSTIHIARVPGGSRFFGMLIQMPDQVNAATFHIGDSDDADRLFSSLDVNAAAIAPTSFATGVLADAATPTKGFGYLYTTETDIYITVNTATLDSSELIKGCLVFTSK